MRDLFIVEYKEYVDSYVVNVYLYDPKSDMYDKDLEMSKSFENKQIAQMYASKLRRSLAERQLKGTHLMS